MWLMRRRTSERAEVVKPRKERIPVLKDSGVQKAISSEANDGDGEEGPAGS
jgi:hypothetical protein